MPGSGGSLGDGDCVTGGSPRRPGEMPRDRGPFPVLGLLGSRPGEARVPGGAVPGVPASTLQQGTVLCLGGGEGGTSQLHSVCQQATECREAVHTDSAVLTQPCALVTCPRSLI